MPRKNTKKNFIWNAVGLTLNALNSLFFLIVVRYINGVDTAGIFTYAFALCSLFFIISTYFNRSFQIASHKHFSFNDFLSARIILSVVSLIVVIIFSLVNHFTLFEFGVISLLMLFRIVESISDCFYGAIHAKSHLYQAGISLSLKAILGLAIFTLTDYLSGNLLLAIGSLTLTNFLIFFAYDTKNYRRLFSAKFHFHWRPIKSILKICFPVFLFSALSLYLANCQKYILPYFESYEIQTIFGILIMPATVISLIGSYLINPSLPTLADHYESRRIKNYSTLSTKIILATIFIGIFFTIAASLIGIPILELIYQLDLSAYQLSLILIIIASTNFALAMILSSLLTILKENRRQTYIYIIASIATTIISIFLIKSLGITGAVYSFLTSSIILIALYFILFYLKLSRLKNS